MKRTTMKSYITHRLVIYKEKKKEHNVYIGKKKTFIAFHINHEKIRKTWITYGMKLRSSSSY